MFRTVRQQINLAKPELWLVPGTHYYVWVFIVVLLSSWAPLVLLCNWQTIMASGWYGIINLGFLSAGGMASLVFVLSRLPGLLRSDAANKNGAHVARREARFFAWFTGLVGAMTLVGFLFMKLIKVFA